MKESTKINVLLGIAIFNMIVVAPVILSLLPLNIIPINDPAHVYFMLIPAFVALILGIILIHQSRKILKTNIAEKRIKVKVETSRLLGFISAISASIYIGLMLYVLIVFGVLIRN